MKWLPPLLIACAAAASAQAAPPAKTSFHYGSMAGADLGIGADLHGAVPFPADNAWNTDISKAPVDPNSTNLIASMAMPNGLGADFSSIAGGSFGIPYVVVDKNQPRVKIRFNAFGDQSDKGPYPAPPNAPIEGGKRATGDRHVLVIDRDRDRLYEMFEAFPKKAAWMAASGAIFHLDSDDVRPTQEPGWLSADAAGMPIFPGLVRWDEARTGVIPHALRFNAPQTRRAYLPPANHPGQSGSSVDLPPLGMRVRLKASYVIPANFSKESKAILTALKTYGMFVADTGLAWRISGAPDKHWDDARLSSELQQVGRANFEVVKMKGVVTPGS
jgi:hypothetical protein